MMSVQLIASDLDGTLLRNDRTISSRTARALISARERGVTIVAVTARPSRVFTEIPGLARLIDVAICVNGASMVEPASNRVLAGHAMSVPVARKTADALREVIEGVGFGVETGVEVVAEQSYLRKDRIGDRRTILPTLEDVWRRGDPILKLLAYAPLHDVDTLLDVARRHVPTEVEVSHSGGRGLLEISAAGVTKAKTLEQYCAGVDIPAARVIAFGDMPNDVPMLRWAGRSYAMANAHPEARAAADDGTADNQADGVALVIEELAVSGRLGLDG